jgi:NADPH:quinone reductase
LFGQASGATPPLDPHILAKGGGRFLTYATIGQYITDRAQLLSRAKDLFGRIAGGSLRVHIGQEYPLAAAARAHEAIGGRQTTGKSLLNIG